MDVSNARMTDEPENARASSQPRAPLSLKARTAQVSAGMVKQSFSHGRTKTVVVETKRRRVEPGAGGQAGVNLAERRAASGDARPSLARPSTPTRQPGGLSEDERRARQRAIELARQHETDRLARVEAERTAVAPAPVAIEDAAAPPMATPRPAAPAGAGEPAAAERADPAPGAAASEPPAAGRTEPPAVPPPAGAPPVATVTPTPRAARAADPAAPAPRLVPRLAGAPAGRLPPSGRVAPPPRSPEAPRPPTAPGQTRTYEPSRERRDDRPTTTTYRPERPSVAYNQRVGQVDRRGEGAPAPRSSRPSGAPGTDRPTRPGETVRYSANAPRTLRDAGRPGAAAGRAAAPPSAPEITRSGRQPPRAGAHLDRRPEFDEEEAARGKAGPGKAVSRTRGEPRRREGRLTIQAVAGDDEGAVERMRSLASVRRAREREREKRKGGAQDTGRTAREVVIPDIITVQELAQRMATRSVEVIKFLVRQGLMLKATDVIDNDTAELVATEFGHTVKRVSESDVETGFLADDDTDEDTEPRPPVVTVMGHVDHGKTSLLDALRATDVAAGERGGITQHIGAYQVRLADGERITFLDTPGHAAFSAMRARGANITDIVVLVVAADDGVMPQTIEAIQHAKAAGAPIIVAINKIDKPDANPTRVINELLQHEIVVESLGGETQAVQVSALKKEGLEELIEAILVQSQVMELKANPDRTAEGVVVEGRVDRGRGAVATVLVKRGTLRRGDMVVSGAAYGRVRALLNERDEQVAEAGPSSPVEILGLDNAPDPGEPFAVVESEARARELTDYRIRLKRERTMAPIGAGGTLAEMMAKLADKKVAELPLLIKADVQGSAEAIVGSIAKIGTDEVRARIILSGAGGINESDVMLAKGAGAPIIGFNVRASRQARDLAEREGVEIRYYAIIYDLLDDIKGVMSGLLAPAQRENFLGLAEVLQVFDITKVGKIAGCRVREGVVRRGARVRIIREDVVVLELGVLQTLKRFKDDVAEVASGFECGMAFQGFQDIKEGDSIECFTLEEVKRTL